MGLANKCGIDHTRQRSDTFMIRDTSGQDRPLARPHGRRRLWLALGGAGLLFRTVQLFFVRDVPTGLIWATKIITDPFNDFKQYRHAPVRLLKGERLDANIATR